MPVAARPVSQSRDFSSAEIVKGDHHSFRKLQAVEAWRHKAFIAWLCFTPIALALPAKTEVFAIGTFAFYMYMLSRLHKSSLTGFAFSLPRHYPASTLYLIAILWAGATALWSPEPSFSILLATFMLLMAAPILYVATLQSRRIPELVTASVLALVVVLTLMNGWYIFEYGSIRSGYDSQGNRSAAYLTCITPLLCWLYLEKRISLAAWLALLALVSLNVLLSGSRGGIIALAIAIALSGIMLLLHGGAVRKLLKAALIIFPVVAVAIALDLGGIQSDPHSALNRLSVASIKTTILPSAEQVESHELKDRQRTLMYYEGRKLIEEMTLQGAGLGAVAYIMEQKWGSRIHSHNTLITALGELGMVGFALMLALVAIATRNSYRTYQFSSTQSTKTLVTALYLGLVVTLICGMYRLQYDSPITPLLLACLETTCIGTSPAIARQDA